MTIKRPVIVPVDQRYIDLQVELHNHPELLAKLAQTAPDMADKLACIATHLGLAVETVLDIESVHKMMAGFTEELKNSRQLLILPGSTHWRH